MSIRQALPSIIAAGFMVGTVVTVGANNNKFSWDSPAGRFAERASEKIRGKSPETQNPLTSDMKKN
ncbi:hypothetical protein DID78_01000 [Candidatus Marinamargulisbacteria bacterium SCGC AG-343-D04]|nr:hypothetical protein DID78_01000 [Candidatus Marinamargulisbacteria bacterium SCGC AG-343-D04]